MIYTLISGLIEKMNKDNDERKNEEASEKDRKEREKEVEELVSVARTPTLVKLAL